MITQFKEELDGQSEKKLVQSTISLVYFHLQFSFIVFFFRESVENFISDKMTRKKFVSDKDRFLLMESYNLKTAKHN